MAAAAKSRKESSSPVRNEAPNDIMTKKGYYDALIDHREELKEKVKVLSEEIEAETIEQGELEEKIAAMQQWLDKAVPELDAKIKERDQLDRTITDLEEGGLDDEAIARKMKLAALAAMGIEERVKHAREEFNASVLKSGGAPPEHILPFSATPRGVGAEDVSTADFVAKGAGELTVPVRCYSCPGKSPSAVPAPPAIVFFHGGGYISGDLQTHDWFCRNLSLLSGASVVAVDYRRAPEHRYPAALDDAYAALQWVSAGGLGQPPRRIAVAGDCAGGGLAAACCLRARDDPEGPQISLQLLAYPLIDLRSSSSSWKSEYGTGKHGLTTEELQLFREAYSPAGADADGGGAWTEDTGASPLAAESLAGLPRAFVVYPVHTCVAADAVAFVDRLRKEVGHEAVHTMRVEGPFHNFAIMAHEKQAHPVISAAATFASALLWA